MTYDLNITYADPDLYPGGLQYQHEGDAGMDLRCSHDVDIPAHDFHFVDFGISFNLPKRTNGEIRPRSGLARRHGLFAVLGTVDENFTGPVGGTIINFGGEDLHFKRGDRVAQLVIVPVLHVNVREVAELAQNSARGDAGYGSSGVE